MKKFAWFCIFSVAGVAAEQQLGRQLSLPGPVSVDQLLSDPEPSIGKTVQIKGKVTEVCQMMGCWMSLVDPQSGKSLRVKVNDGDIVFPKESVGKMAIAEGTLKKFVLSKEQVLAAARHEAEEQGRKFNPTSVKGGKTVYQIQGTGAVLLD